METTRTSITIEAPSHNKEIASSEQELSSRELFLKLSKEYEGKKELYDKCSEEIATCKKRISQLKRQIKEFEETVANEADTAINNANEAANEEEAADNLATLQREAEEYKVESTRADVELAAEEEKRTAQADRDINEANLEAEAALDELNLEALKREVTEHGAGLARAEAETPRTERQKNVDLVITVLGPECETIQDHYSSSNGARDGSNLAQVLREVSLTPTTDTAGKIRSLVREGKKIVSKKIARLKNKRGESTPAKDWGQIKRKAEKIVKYLTIIGAFSGVGAGVGGIEKKVMEV